MPLPLTKNCRPNEEEGGVDFEVEINGRTWTAFITFEYLTSLYAAKPNRIRAVSQSSYITRKVAERIGVGDPGPIFLPSTMFP